jgi:hypothetical protein
MTKRKTYRVTLEYEDDEIEVEARNEDEAEELAINESSPSISNVEVEEIEDE